ncbi:MAG TPA: NAD-dependent epimerase/dehydratase family protein [Solirubrobacteraceae bacterium]|nr:NAD-dependent epimerase/dehydratase family protein [Solirubrobacteraceae bacterium]
MRVVIVGATGNVGTSLLRALAHEPAVDEIVGVARRVPGLQFEKTAWRQADIVSDDLAGLFRGADCVVHLAWAIQPSHDEQALWRVNVYGGRRVFQAAAQAGVASLVYASSVGAYSRGPKDRAVDESWPTNGIPTSFYSRHKAETERLLDALEREHPGLRVVRLRPGLIFKREAAAEIRRLFAGPLVPGLLAHPRLIPIVPDIPGLRVQAVHSYDVGEAYRQAIVRQVRGAFNVAAEPVLDATAFSAALDARAVRVPARVARGLVAATWRLHLQPTPAGWVDLALGVPILDTTRARTELGWQPRWGADEALLDLLDGLRGGDGLGTPPLAPRAGGRARERELATGVGSRQ